MRTELDSKWLRGALIPALLCSGLIILSGCGDSAEQTNKAGGAAVIPLATDRKALDESKNAMMKRAVKR
jgi:hypothetical protein